MAEAPLEALKSLGKTLGQMSLYKIGHPAVAATLEIAERHLGEALSREGGELSFTADGDKLVCNGRVVGSLRDLPTTIASVFTRFKLSSMTFRAGVTNAELAAFCELTAVRPGSAATPNPAAFLAERAVTHISFNEAVYTKADAANAAATGQAGAGEAATAASTSDTEAAAEAILAQVSLDKMIETLVQRAVPDSKRRAEVYAKVMQLLKEDIEKRVEEASGDLKKQAAVLQNEQARTQGVLSNMVEGVVMVDDQGKILMMNPAAEQLYGATLAEVAGQPLTAKGEATVVTLANELTTPTDRAIDAAVAQTGEDDAKKTIKAAGAIVQNQEGKVVGVVSQLTDVAKHKELQRMQRDFVAHVTHELRAPLASIRAAMEILQGEVADRIKEDESRMLNTALKNADRLSDLINSILDFSKIESGQMTVFPKKVDPEKIARDGVDSLAAWAAKKRVNLSLVSEPALPPVNADVPRTVQVLVNLLSNAIKFTPVGGSITVRAKLSTEKTGGERFVEYSVTDTGPGIPKADQKRVFEKFVQIAAGEMHVGGTGLGLAIAKALVHLHGGKMWLESEEGRGSTFLFTLPVWTPPKDTTTGLPKAAPPKPKPWWKALLGLK